MNKELKKRIDSIGNKEAVKFFWLLIKNLIDELKLNADNEKLSINVRNDYRKRISVCLNGRLVLGIKDGAEFYFMVNDEDLEAIEKVVTLGSKENFGKQQTTKASLITINYYLLIANIDTIKEFWLKSCKLYEPLQDKSEYRKYHMPELYELAEKPNLLNAYLDNSMPLTTNTFTDIVEQFKVYLKGEDNVLNEFEVLEVSDLKKEKYAWVWIADHKKEIGGAKVHYEVHTPNKKIRI